MATIYSIWIVGYRYILTAIFVTGSALFWFPLLGMIRIGRTSRLALLLERIRQKDESAAIVEIQYELMSDKERAYAERARLAGLPIQFTYTKFKFISGALAFSFIILNFISQVPNINILYSLDLSSGILLFFKLVFSGLFGWWLPMIYVIVVASQRRSEYLIEIAKYSQRLSICVNDKADIRDMLIRASRPLKLLKPQLQELTLMWGKDQKAAIWRFKESVGISEVFPLVNALEAISQADAKEVVKVLKEQTASIEATLESDINRKIENAPIWISIMIMIPFGMIVILFLYPWVITVTKQLLTSFPGS